MSWIISEVDQSLYGGASGLGADKTVLASKSATCAYLLALGKLKLFSSVPLLSLGSDEKEEEKEDTSETERIKKGVFILCGQNPGLTLPKGTIFAFSPRLALTANHNRFLFSSPSDGVYNEFQAVRSIHRGLDGVATLIDAVKLKLVSYDEDEDWAVFEPAGKNIIFSDPLTIASGEELPELEVPSRTQRVKAYFSPVAYYLHEDHLHVNLHVQADSVTAVSHYEPNPIQKQSKITKVRTMTSAEFAKTVPVFVSKCDVVVCSGGLVSGSCGGPYLDNGTQKVIAFHLYSGSESLSIPELLSELGKRKECDPGAGMDTECAIGGYHTFKRGFVLARLRSFVLFARSKGIELNTLVQYAPVVAVSSSRVATAAAAGSSRAKGGKVSSGASSMTPATAPLTANRATRQKSNV